MEHESVMSVIAKEVKSVAEGVVKMGISENKSHPAIMVIEWNRQTMELFDGHKRPRQGHKYVLKCTRFDGARAYFILEQM